MTKRRSSVADSLVKPARKLDTVATSEQTSNYFPSAAAIRETIESIVVAFILAFLFRTFEAEAFVIPTGSMAPTLMGRHKDFNCPKCGFPYQVSASQEVDVQGRTASQRDWTVAGTCPICRYTADLGPNNPQHENYPSYSGDRILVCKFAYQFAEPQRWDVVVFKFPGDGITDARTNFIKRLIGLPGETVRIQNGDIWVRREGEPFKIARKPPEKLLAMLQMVFDNDYMPKISLDGWPARWRYEPKNNHSELKAWRTDDQTTFVSDGSEGEHWLRYYHLTPNYHQWSTLEQSGRRPREMIPQLIRDFTAYNTVRTQGNISTAPEADAVGLYWVGDLALRFSVELNDPKGKLLLELRKGGRHFYCSIDVATGRATLSISGQDMEHFRPQAETAVCGSGQHEIMFSNCDNELRLWVDGRVVQFDSATTYDDLGNHLPESSDLTPVGIAAVGAKLKISHLVILRDLYYIANLPYGNHRRYTSADPNVFAGEVSDGSPLRNRTDAMAEFVLKKDQFFVLGDNSARSKDSRLWGEDNYWVPRELLVGKALFIYWPHSWNRIPYLNLPCPYFPNFAKMRPIR